MKRKFVSAQKLTNGPKVYRKWDDWSEGDLVLGEYIETFEDQYKKPVRVLKVIEAEFKDKTGKDYLDKNLALNNAGMLAKAFEKNDVQFGQIVQIIYNGTGKIEKGLHKGKDSHSFDVDIMREEASEDVDL